MMYDNVASIFCPIIFLRNLNAAHRLCNGTRLTLLGATTQVLTCKIINGSNGNKTILIPRISLDKTDNAYPFVMTRHQFPVRLILAMTINKAQGQPLTRVGVIYMNQFLHTTNYMWLYQDPASQEKLEFIFDMYTKSKVISTDTPEVSLIISFMVKLYHFIFNSIKYE